MRAGGLVLLAAIAACGGDVEDRHGGSWVPEPGARAGDGDSPPLWPTAAEYSDLTDPGALYFANFDDNASGPGDPIPGNDMQLAWGTVQDAPQDVLYVALYEGFGTFSDGGGARPFDSFTLPLVIDIGADPVEQDYDTCGTCISVLEAADADGNYTRQLVATSGTLEITALPTGAGATFSAVLTDAVLEEIDLFGDPVADGVTSTVTRVELTVMARAELPAPTEPWVPLPCAGYIHCVGAGDSIQAAVDAAAAGDVIQVAEGLYGENVEVFAKPLTIVGGLSTDFQTWDPDAHTTTVVAAAAGSVFDIENAGGTRLQGFWLTGGSGTCIWGCDGGGVFLLDGPYTIAGNVIVGNTLEVDGEGGGIFLLGSATIVNNVVASNVGGRGGGMSLTATAPTTIAGNLVDANVGLDSHGGGMALSGGPFSVTNNLIRSNAVGIDTLYGWGGGVLYQGLGTTATSSGNVFTDNSAPSLASALFVDDESIVDSDHDLFYANQCTENGGTVIYVDGLGVTQPSTLTLTHATVSNDGCVDNTAIYVENSTISVRNSILVGSTSGVFVFENSTSDVTYSLLSDASADPTNLTGDPQFVDAAGGDFHVLATSPTIDRGDPADPFAAEPSPNGGRVNLGHTGNTAEATPSP